MILVVLSGVKSSSVALYISTVPSPKSIEHMGFGMRKARETKHQQWIVLRVGLNSWHDYLLLVTKLKNYVTFLISLIQSNVHKVVLS